MTIEKKTELIISLIEELITQDPGFFLVDEKLKPGNSIQVLLDADQGVSLNKCVAYHRALFAKIEEASFFEPGDFLLEVSSPGLDEPLKMSRQYVKNIGRLVEVVLKDGRKISGKLLTAEPQIVIEETIARLSSKERNKDGGQGKGKKQPDQLNRSNGETVQHTFLLDQIKTTKIQIVF